MHPDSTNLHYSIIGSKFGLQPSCQSLRKEFQCNLTTLGQKSDLKQTFQQTSTNVQAKAGKSSTNVRQRCDPQWATVGAKVPTTIGIQARFRKHSGKAEAIIRASFHQEPNNSTKIPLSSCESSPPSQSSDESQPKLGRSSTIVGRKLDTDPKFDQDFDQRSTVLPSAAKVRPKFDQRSTKVRPKFEHSSTKVRPKLDQSPTTIRPKFDEAVRSHVPHIVHVRPRVS